MLNERFFRGTWRRAQLGKKTAAISKLARDMDLPVKLARRYEEMAREHQGNALDEQKMPEDKRALDSPLFRVSNHHTDDCGQPPAVDGMNLASTTATLPINTASRRSSSTITRPTRRLSGWATPIGMPRTAS